MMFAGVRPTMRFASAPIASTRLGPRLDGNNGRLADHDASIPDVDERVGGPEVDPEVPGEQAEEAVEHAQGCVLVGGGDGPTVGRAPREVGAGTAV